MKKAQIQLFESIAVMVVFAFLLVFGINFYFRIEATSVAREELRANQLRVFSLAQKTAFLPEMDCAIAGIQQEACIDVSKLQAFSTMLANDPDAQQLYFPVFGWSTVTIQQIYGSCDTPCDPLAPTNITLYDDTPPKYTDLSKVQVPILLFNATTGNYAYGYIEVTHYAK
jgi:type II secretory pathway pseudopilin PulG